MSETNQKLTQDFYTHFQTSRSELNARLETLQTSVTDPEALKQIAHDVAKLRKELTDAIGFLPAYDQRQCDLKLKEVEALLEKLRASAAPKPKFSFKRKANPTPSSPSPSDNRATQAIPPAVAPSTQTGTSQTNSLILTGQTHRYLTLSSLPVLQSSESSDLAISEISHCIINLTPLAGDAQEASAAPPSYFTALHARNITDSILILPHINGSALLHDLTRCIIVLGCHQFRMHTSSDVDVYLSVLSNPIIEHCKGIRFAHYPSLLYPSGQPMSTESKHAAVQDFSHIRATPSPNWSVLQEDKRIADTQWPTASVSSQHEIDILLRTHLSKA
ncbi:hypothetical protein CERSUDRAFT_155385 [Gelatoporia subvermispora B]|uniref:C-CAP/cofactor C-like domain-containing protein n=1 Tax=Ceriporiopsis subvermispora (strain B) TaxID=914234 RepID=M2PL25_CERS8|nr:hypothetical protein CERSUDRAFT_155385 [Gelatoporia subvermispora B]